MSLILKALGKKYRKHFLRLNNYFIKISSIERAENCTKAV